MYLVEQSKQSPIRVHIVPNEVGAHAGLAGAFTIASMDGGDFVYLDNWLPKATTRPFRWAGASPVRRTGSAFHQKDRLTGSGAGCLLRATTPSVSVGGCEPRPADGALLSFTTLRGV
jgi:hypothetical protein